MKTQTKIETSFPAGYISMGDYLRLLHIYAISTKTLRTKISYAGQFNGRESCGDAGVGAEGSGPPPLSKNHKAIGTLSNTGLVTLKNHKATKPAFNVWPSLAPSEMPLYGGQ